MTLPRPGNTGCKFHTDYDAAKPPRNGCQWCWRFWYWKQREKAGVGVGD